MNFTFPNKRTTVDLPQFYADIGICALPKHLPKLIVMLSERERNVVLAFVEQNKTLERIGQENGITRERIKQVYNRAVRRIQTKLLQNLNIDSFFRSVNNERLGFIEPPQADELPDGFADDF